MRARGIFIIFDLRWHSWSIPVRFKDPIKNAKHQSIPVFFYHKMSAPSTVRTAHFSCFMSPTVNILLCLHPTSSYRTLISSGIFSTLIGQPLRTLVSPSTQMSQFCRNLPYSLPSPTVPWLPIWSCIFRRWGRVRPSRSRSWGPPSRPDASPPAASLQIYLFI